MRNKIKFPIAEIFYSIQVEGFNAGMPAIFVRFAGCNLSCVWCDTDYSLKETLNIDELIERIYKTGKDCRNVIFTGGEPTEQKNLSILCKELSDWFKCIETNGTNKINAAIDWITVSPKVGVIMKNQNENSELVLLKGNEIKIVLTDETQPYLDKYLGLDFKYHYLQPESMKNTSEVIKYVKQHPKWRMSYQWNKIVNIR